MALFQLRPTTLYTIATSSTPTCKVLFVGWTLVRRLETSR